MIHFKIISNVSSGEMADIGGYRPLGLHTQPLLPGLLWLEEKDSYLSFCKWEKICSQFLWAVYFPVPL